MCLFLKGGQVYPVPPYLSPRRPCVVVSLRRYWWVTVMGRCIQGNEVLRELGWLGEPCHAYLRRLKSGTDIWSRCFLFFPKCTINFDE